MNAGMVKVYQQARIATHLQFKAYYGHTGRAQEWSDELGRCVSALKETEAFIQKHGRFAAMPQRAIAA
jgi:hypothetical protein